MTPQLYWTLPGLIDILARANADGSDQETLVDNTQLNNPSSIALDLENEHIYIVDSGIGDRILRTNLDGSDLQVIVPDAGNNPEDIAIDPVNGKLYWTIPGITDQVRRANLDGSNVETVLNTRVLNNPNGIALDSVNGHIYVADSGAGDRIIRANLDGSDVTVVIPEAGNNPQDLALDLANGQLYWSIPGATDEIRRANLDGSNVEIILDTRVLENPNGIALDVAAGQIYIADGGAGDVLLRANLDGSDVETLPIEAGDNPRGIALIAREEADPIQVSVFAEPDTPLSEGEQTPGTFVFRLSQPAPEGGLVIHFQAADTDPDPNSRDVTIGASGTTNIDTFTIRPIPGFTSTVTITEGATEARLGVTPFPDGLVEDPETISLSLLPGDNYIVDINNASAGLTLLDEEGSNSLSIVTISIENLSPENGTFLTPLWFGFHDGTFDTYDRGRPVSPGLESLAEDGATDLISQEFDLAGFGTVQGTILGTEGTPGPIDPGETATFTIELDGSDPSNRFFSYASMLIPSNDFFIANGNERAHAIFDEEGHFIGADFIIFGNTVLDAGSEVNDELPTNTAFFGQMNPNTGVTENGVVRLAEGFIPNGPILSDPRFNNADFTAPGYKVASVQVFAEHLTPLEGSGGQHIFTVTRNNTFTIKDFGGVGLGSVPSADLIDEIDTIQFKGDGLTAEHLLITQEGNDLHLRFDGIRGTGVILRDVALDDLDNLPEGDGNILFEGDTEIQDSFDVLNADSTQSRVFNRNTVTFLNNLNNGVQGFNRSADVINGQGGDDTLLGLSGDDWLRGGDGNDTLNGGPGNDILDGGLGSDILTGGPGGDTFRFGDDLLTSGGDDTDIITDFAATDRFDFSTFFKAGGQISVVRLTDRLTVNLSSGDTVMVQGDVDAAFDQVSPIASAVALF